MWDETKKTDREEKKKAAERFVMISGLKSEVGQKLNGRVGEIMVKENKDGRLGVEVDGGAGRKLLKKENCLPISENDLVSCYLLPDHILLWYPKRFEPFFLPM